MRIIKISLNLILCFMKDQEKPKKVSPKTINVFSFIERLLMFLKKK